MDVVVRAAVLVACFRASFANTTPACVIELECRECIPDHMPQVLSPAARGGRVAAAQGAALRLSCGPAALLAYPGRREISVTCDNGRYRVAHDNSLRHLLELGCQEDLFEDVLHQVEGCAPPLQGRAYAAAGAARHVALLCFDADAAVARRAHAASAARNDLQLGPHAHSSAPLTILGNFNHMFDATTRAEGAALFSDDASATRRLRELLRHDAASLAEQSVAPARLLAPHYFEDQNARVADFVSNKVVSWRSVTHGNWQHVQHDVSRAMRAAQRANVTLHVVAGTRGVLAVRGARGRVPVALRAQGRFPAPRYLWTAVLDPQRRAGVAVVVLNDPFVAVSEIKEAVFCESACSGVSWLRALRRNRNYETPLLGLAFCCSLGNFTDVATELPKNTFPGLDSYSMLTDLDFDFDDSDTIRNIV